MILTLGETVKHTTKYRAWITPYYFTSHRLVTFFEYHFLHIFWIIFVHCKDMLKALIFLNLTADFPPKLAKMPIPKNSRDWFLIHGPDKLRFWGGLCYHLKWGIILFFHTYTRLVKFSRHHLLFGLFFCPVKLSGLFFLRKRPFWAAKTAFFKKHGGRRGRVSKTHPPFFRPPRRIFEMSRKSQGNIQ